MSAPQDPDPRPQQSKTVSLCVIVCVVIGIVGFQILAPQFFPPRPEGGFDWQRVLWAGLVGGASAVLGAALGKVIEMITKK